MRRLRSILLLLALASAVFAGSTSAVDAHESTIAAAAPHQGAPAAAFGKRWK